MKKPRKRKQSFFRKKIFIIPASLLFLALAVPFSLFFYVYLEIPGPVPNAEVLKNIKNPEASMVYDAERQNIGKYYIYDRTGVQISDINPHVIHALIATEDARFYEHSGVDFRSLLRVFFKTILLGNENAGGGSTISQQLAKNLFPRKEYRFMSMAVNKIREMIVATRLEKIYSKEEILNAYLNTVPFSDNVFGIESASRRFFSKKSSDLALHEAALLVGTLKGNSLYNPRTNPENALERRNVVIHLMFAEGYITGQERDISLETTMGLRLTNVDQENFAAYFLDRVAAEAKLILDEQGARGGKQYNLYTDGLKIYTTLDKTMQQYAEQALHEHMKRLQGVFDTHWKSSKPWDRNRQLLERAIRATPQYKEWKGRGLSDTQMDALLNEKRKMEVFTWEGPREVEFSTVDSVKHYLMVLQAGLIGLDPASGHVKVWVGGVDHHFFKYDHVNVNTKRQVGSTFKPFVYASALENGISPCHYYDASQASFEEKDQEWQPTNADDNYEGQYSMEGALRNSVNTVSVKILEDVGVEKVIKNCQDMGISSDIPPYPSIALGTPSISLFEMAGAYSVFANQGRVVKPVFLLKIEDKEGNVLWEAAPEQSRQVYTRETTLIMTEMMRGVVNGGTAARLRTQYGLANDFAGKTGTTQHNADGWFMGYLPGLVVGVWVGADNPGVHFRTTALGQGANTALPIFAGFFSRLNQDAAYNGVTRKRFKSLPEDLRAQLDCDPFKEEQKFFDFLFGKNKKRRAERKKDKENQGVFKKIGNLFKKKE